MRRRLAMILAALVVVAGSPLVLAAAPTLPPADAKTWGDHPLDDVLAAATAYKRCGLSTNRLAAMMMAPAWPETGAPNSLAPSPMTLSRWDTSTGLEAFGSDTYPQAFFHPGVGLWQFDSSGLGSPYSASETIDTRVIANVMAREIVRRWCDHTPQGDINYVWAPWVGCRNGRCLEIFLEIYNPDTGTLRNLNAATDVDSTGGMEARTCQAPGISGRFTCWRVDPTLAQGYDAFAQPGGGPSPITAPFYVYSAGGHEYRHWLQDDTGYDRGIWATRPLGQNARTSLTWHSGDALCDLTTATGACCPVLTAASSCLATRVAGTYTPVSGDFNGDGQGDVLWYGPGSAPDRLWFGTVYGVFSAATVTVGGTYEPVSGDFDGDGRDDIVWYAPGATQDYVWYGRANRSFVGQRVNAAGNWTPISGDFDGDGHFDVFWYGVGTDPDFVWYGLNRQFTGRPVSVGGTAFRPFAGDFDGDRHWDVFWYLPGAGQDTVWYGAERGSFAGQAQTINGDYVPVSGKLNVGRRYDIVWYTPGEAADVVFLSRPGRTFEPHPVDIDGTYEPFVGDFTGDGPDDVFWYGPGAADDVITRGG